MGAAVNPGALNRVETQQPDPFPISHFPFPPLLFRVHATLIDRRE
jgi:hypothetical protein